MTQPDQISLLERNIDSLQLGPPAVDFTPVLSVQSDHRASHRATLSLALAASDSYIARLLKIRSKLNEIVMTFQAHHNAVRYSQASVSALPPEILGSIFIHTTLASRTTSLIRDTCRLSHVCSSWRQAALSHANLWSRIDLAGLMVPDSRIETWLSRTANVALHLQVIPLVPKLRGSLLPRKPVMAQRNRTDDGSELRYISRLQPRISHLDLEGPFFPFSASFDSLRVLRLWSPEISHHSLTPSSLRHPTSYGVFLHQIQMSNLEVLECGSMDFFDISEGLSTPKLKHISLIDGPNPSSWIQMFQAYPNLQSLHLRRLTRARYRNLVENPLKHTYEVTSLRHLKIIHCDELVVRRFFEELDCSCLEELDLAFYSSEVMRHIPSDNPNAISEALSTPTSLTTLHLRGGYEDMAHFLHQSNQKFGAETAPSSLFLPNVHTLTIDLLPSTGIPPLENCSIVELLQNFILIPMGFPARRLGVLSVAVDVLPDVESRRWFIEHVDKLEIIPMGWDKVGPGVPEPDWTN